MPYQIISPMHLHPIQNRKKIYCHQNMMIYFRIENENTDIILLWKYKSDGPKHISVEPSLSEGYLKNPVHINQNDKYYYLIIPLL